MPKRSGRPNLSAAVGGTGWQQWQHTPTEQQRSGDECGAVMASSAQNFRCGHVGLRVATVQWSWCNRRKRRRWRRRTVGTARGKHRRHSFQFELIFARKLTRYRFELEEMKVF
uniref:(northern house mosquito) hypothetical protein n=1 Tax=Culex pipiens TaxID=7175 RepID=A0A8D8CX38_CULPI